MGLEPGSVGLWTYPSKPLAEPCGYISDDEGTPKIELQRA